MSADAAGGEPDESRRRASSRHARAPLQATRARRRSPRRGDSRRRRCLTRPRRTRRWANSARGRSCAGSSSGSARRARSSGPATTPPCSPPPTAASSRPSTRSCTGPTSGSRGRRAYDLGLEGGRRQPRRHRRDGRAPDRAAGGPRDARRDAPVVRRGHRRRPARRVRRAGARLRGRGRRPHRVRHADDRGDRARRARRTRAGAAQGRARRATSWRSRASSAPRHAGSRCCSSGSGMPRATPSPIDGDSLTPAEAVDLAAQLRPRPRSRSAPSRRRPARRR